jgi:hypothetical protein
VAPSLLDPVFGEGAALLDAPADLDGEVRIDYTPCGIAPDLAASGSRADRSPRAAGGPGCPLTVTFSASKMLAGLSRDGRTDVAFIGESNNACLSGCVKVTATVTNSQGNPVADASIDASVTPISDGLAPYPSGAKPGPGYLCSASKPTDCGSSGEISDQTTDGNGQVSLLYWAPGVTANTETAQITIKATGPCGSGCTPGRQPTGENTMPVTVKSHMVYQADMDVPKELAETLADWADDLSWLKIGKSEARSTVMEKLIKKAAEYLTEEDEIVEKVEGGAGALIGGVEQMLGIARATQLQWIFLSGFKVSPTGLGQSPNGDVVSTKPARAFEDVWIKQGNIMRIGSVGLLWQLALDELDAKDKGPLTNQNAHLNVFEVSYCTQGMECGPGYHDRPGIAPYLDFEMTVGEHDQTIMGYQQVAFPYNARAWFLTQFYSH